MMLDLAAAATKRARPSRPRQRNQTRPRIPSSFRSFTCDKHLWISQRIRLLPSRAEAEAESGGRQSKSSKIPSASVVGTTRTVGICTIICKVTGLVREVMLTSLFGIGPVMDAFAFSCVVPAYFQTVLGGVNGPIHTAMLISLKRSKGKGGENENETKQVTESLSSWVLLPAILIALVLYAFPFAVIKMFAPGLGPGGQASVGMSIATEQLKVMSPCVLTGALTGIAFGALNAANHFVSPSISPALGNLVMIASLLFMRSGGAATTSAGLAITASADVIGAGRHLAVAFALGSASQLLLQAWVMHKERVSGFFRLRLRLADWKYFLDTMKILLPTCLSSTMLQLATYTDLWFASSWPGAAAVMACAALVITAPLGLLSNVIIIPRMPRLAQVAAEENWREVKSVCDGMLRTSVNVGLPLSISLVAFASQAVRLVYERSAFTANSTLQVAPVVVVYALGITCFLSRDIILRTFYALGKGRVPTVTSVIALALNAVLDHYFGQKLSLSAVGLVLSTVSVTFVSVLVLYGILCRDLQRHSLIDERDADADKAATECDDPLDADIIVGKLFFSTTVLAAGAASVYCKWLLNLLPNIQTFLTWKGLQANFLANSLVVGALFASCWIVYYIVFHTSCKILKRVL